jgi:hypothetical protein
VNNKEKRKSLRGFTGGCEGGEETQKRASESFSHHSLPASHSVVEFKLAVIQRNRTLIASASSLVCFLFNSVSFSISHCSTLLDICNLAVLYWYYASLRLRIYTAGILYFFTLVLQHMSQSAVSGRIPFPPVAILMPTDHPRPLIHNLQAPWCEGVERCVASAFCDWFQ